MQAHGCLCGDTAQNVPILRRKSSGPRALERDRSQQLLLSHDRHVQAATSGLPYVQWLKRRGVHAKVGDEDRLPSLLHAIKCAHANLAPFRWHRLAVEYQDRQSDVLILAQLEGECRGVEKCAGVPIDQSADFVEAEICVHQRMAQRAQSAQVKCSPSLLTQVEDQLA